MACIVLGDTLFTTSAGIISGDNVNFLTSNEAESSQQGRRSRKKPTRFAWDCDSCGCRVPCKLKTWGWPGWSSKWSQILDCSQSGGWLFYKLHRKNYFMLHMRNNHTNSSNRYTRSTASHWCDWHSFLMCLFCKIVKLIIFVKRVIIHTLHINCWVCFVNKLTRKGVLKVF